MNQFEFRAMNTDIQLFAEGPAEAVETGFSQAKAYVEASEKRFTRFSDDSELSQLNALASAWFEASPELFDVMSQALRLHSLTEGLFDPSILNALVTAGYDRSFDEIRTHGAGTATLPVRQSLHRFSDVRLDSVRRRVWLPPDLRVDLGGIAKGWIAEKAAQVLAKWSNACVVNAGGDAFIVGLPAGEPAWRMTLEDPLDKEKGIAVLKVGPGAVVTSSITRRRWQQNGQTRHHLIDPRTQQPAETDWLSVTVIAPHAAEAEVFAKSLLIVGSAQATQVASRGQNIEFIAVDQNKQLWGSQHSREVLDV
jgi:thiamine biosynthesis lipoprotein